MELITQRSRSDKRCVDYNQETIELWEDFLSYLFSLGVFFKSIKGIWKCFPLIPGFLLTYEVEFQRYSKIS